MADQATATPAAQADAVDREKRRAELSALAAAAALLAQAREDAVAHWRHLRDAGQAVADSLVGNARSAGLATMAAGAAAVAWLLGRKRTVRAAVDAGVDEAAVRNYDSPTPREQQVITDDFARQAGGLVGKLARRAAERVTDAVGSLATATASAVRAAVARAMDAVGVGPRPIAKPGQQPPRVWPGSWAVQQLLEYMAGVGHSRGTDEVLAVPAVAMRLTHYVYLTQRDTIVRPFHRALDKMVRPVADPIWQAVTPPAWSWKGKPQYGCRCVRLPVFNGQMAETALPAELA